VFTGSISVGLDIEGSIVSACTEHKKFEFWRCYVTLISDIIFLYQLAQARLHNVPHFLVKCTRPVTLISDIIFLYQLAQACPHNVPHFLVKWTRPVTLISDIIFLYQLAQARPHNVPHFLVKWTRPVTLKLVWHKSGPPNRFQLPKMVPRTTFGCKWSPQTNYGPSRTKFSHQNWSKGSFLAAKVVCCTCLGCHEWYMQVMNTKHINRKDSVSCHLSTSTNFRPAVCACYLLPRVP